MFIKSMTSTRMQNNHDHFERTREVLKKMSQQTLPSFCKRVSSTGQVTAALQVQAGSTDSLGLPWRSGLMGGGAHRRAGP